MEKLHDFIEMVLVEATYKRLQSDRERKSWFNRYYYHTVCMHTVVGVFLDSGCNILVKCYEKSIKKHFKIECSHITII